MDMIESWVGGLLIGEGVIALAADDITSGLNVAFEVVRDDSADEDEDDEKEDLSWIFGKR